MRRGSLAFAYGGAFASICSFRFTAFLLGLVGCAVDGRDTGSSITEDTPLSVESWLVNGAKSQNSAFYRQRFVTGN